MKCGVAGAMAVVCMAAQMSYGAESLNILFFGNSFTNNNNVPALFKSVAAATGQKAPNVENAAVNSQTLYYHRTTASQVALISNPTDFTEAAGFHWDYVVLQEYSTKPTAISKGSAGLGNIAGFLDDAQKLYGMVKDHSPSVKPILYETWARSPANTSFYDSTYRAMGDSSSYLNLTARMQAELRSSYDQAKVELDEYIGSDVTRIARVGDAFERDGWYGMYASDNYHQGTKGALLAAMILYQTVYQDDVSDLSYAAMNSQLTLSNYGIANQSAWNSLAALAGSFYATPEPGSLAMLASGAALLLRGRRGRVACRD